MNGSPESPVYYFALLITPENTDSLTGGLVDPGDYMLCLTTKAYWAERHCQIDHTPPEMAQAIASLSFPLYEDMEATYTITPAQLAEIQTNPNFYNHPEFAAFMDNPGMMQA